jgi:hypothetical protein
LPAAFESAAANKTIIHTTSSSVNCFEIVLIYKVKICLRHCLFFSNKCDLFFE